MLCVCILIFVGVWVDVLVCDGVCLGWYVGVYRCVSCSLHVDACVWVGVLVCDVCVWVGVLVCVTVCMLVCLGWCVVVFYLPSRQR